jgi:hypothetical protein
MSTPPSLCHGSTTTLCGHAALLRAQLPPHHHHHHAYTHTHTHTYHHHRSPPPHATTTHHHRCSRTSSRRLSAQSGSERRMNSRICAAQSLTMDTSTVKSFALTAASALQTCDGPHPAGRFVAPTYTAHTTCAFAYLTSPCWPQAQPCSRLCRAGLTLTAVCCLI